MMHHTASVQQEQTLCVLVIARAVSSSVSGRVIRSMCTSCLPGFVYADGALAGMMAITLHWHPPLSLKSSAAPVRLTQG